jgi:glutamine synthetase
MSKRDKLCRLEYVWVDGFKPWGLRAKVRVIDLSKGDIKNLEKGKLSPVPQWGFDGSSTGQANGKDSDCILDPVRVYPDPTYNDKFIVLCQVMNPDGLPHETNKRHALATLVKHDHVVSVQQPWFGMEQEFTILNADGRPTGFPKNRLHYPRPQGIYYCSVGGDRAFGREISEEHLDACITSGVAITGTNSEVMPGQWEYQVGGPGCDALRTSDDLWISRWFLLKVAETRGQTVTFDPKPELGDWNGAGCHTNFSTLDMRKPGGMDFIVDACEKMRGRTKEHLEVYGDDLHLRLTGAHETCSYKEFRWGVADRTASVRIPRHVSADGCGYLEDRRPNANCDPYEVTRVILETTLL